MHTNLLYTGFFTTSEHFTIQEMFGVREKPVIWLEENTTATSKNLYQAYCSWCEDNTEKPISAKSFSGYLKENEKKYHIHYSTNIPSDNGKNARGFQGIHTQIRVDSYRRYR